MNTIPTYQALQASRLRERIQADRLNGEDALRRFGPGYFDLIVVDEAHRSIYHRYGEIFDYFDALLVGLTATPRAEVDHNTYRLFELEDGVPTHAFELDDAIEVAGENIIRC